MWNWKLKNEILSWFFVRLICYQSKLLAKCLQQNIFEMSKILIFPLCAFYYMILSYYLGEGENLHIGFYISKPVFSTLPKQCSNRFNEKCWKNLKYYKSLASSLRNGIKYLSKLRLLSKQELVTLSYTTYYFVFFFSF